MGLRLEDARGQCYDGAAAMAGRKKGVATVIKSLNSKCLYTHCYGHALNLAVGDSIRNVKLLSDTFGTIKEVCNLVKKSPKRETHLKSIRELSGNENRGVHAYCPTRWTIRGQSCQAMIDNYDELMELWDWSLDNVHDTEMKARIRGVQSYMKTFKFLFGCHLGKMILIQTDNLSRTLQDSAYTAVEGQDAAMNTVKALGNIRNEESFKSFWGRVDIDKERLDIDNAELPRKKRRPARCDNYSSDTYHYPATSEEMYRKVYFDAVDNSMQTISSRFEQTDWMSFKNTQEVFLKSLKGEPYQEQLSEVMKIYKDDLIEDELVAQLENLKFCAEDSIDNAADLIKFLQQLTEGQRTFMPQVIILAKLLLVMPATNAVSERSFSALKRLKSYLRSTMTDQRMNNLMTLHVHKDKTDAIDMVAIANKFVEWKENRIQIFGRFSNSDVKPKCKLMSRSTQT